MSAPLIPTRRPILAAPMAGGPTTVALAAAVADAGGFPILAGGYKTAHAVGEEIERLRAHGAPFGVNVVVPHDDEIDATAFTAYAHELEPEADLHGVRLNTKPVADDDHWADKIKLLTSRPVPVVSFTFGLPPAGDLAALQRCGSRVLMTVTTPEEAHAAAKHGADGLIVQGAAAGGHSATFDPTCTPEPLDLAILVTRVRALTGLPVIAAGGIDGAEAVRSVLDAGAVAAAVGTLLLRTDEAGTSLVHRAALADPAFDHTVVTRAFTGRPARALANDFITQHDATAPVAYPAVHHLTRPLRHAAAKAHDAQRVHLWAGTGYRNAPTGSAADVVRSLYPLAGDEPS